MCLTLQDLPVIIAAFSAQFKSVLESMPAARMDLAVVLLLSLRLKS
jgi:hypothetical protein